MWLSVSASINWTVMRTWLPAFRTLPSATYWTFISFATCWALFFASLYLNDDVREMTKRSPKRDKAVRMSSVSPSAKKSCSASPLMLTNGSTMIDGFRLGCAARAGASVRVAPQSTRSTRTGSWMFLSSWTPMSSKPHWSFRLTSSNTLPEMQMPPMGASVWMRAAMFTPSP